MMKQKQTFELYIFDCNDNKLNNLFLKIINGRDFSLGFHNYYELKHKNGQCFTIFDNDYHEKWILYPYDGHSLRFYFEGFIIVNSDLTSALDRRSHFTLDDCDCIVGISLNNQQYFGALVDVMYVFCEREKNITVNKDFIFSNIEMNDMYNKKTFSVFELDEIYDKSELGKFLKGVVNVYPS